MILVTGGCGFIGSNLIKHLNQINKRNIVIIDDLTNGVKYENIKDLQFVDYIDVDDFDFSSVKNFDFVFHEGAISSTVETDGKKVMKYNYTFTKKLIDACVKYNVPISYASSASVYGNSETFCEEQEETPLNLYAFSKTLIDRYVKDILSKDNSVRIQGFRYFNVYGNNESHKGDQASPVSKFTLQSLETGEIRLFENSDRFFRDFIDVEDIVNIKVKMMSQKSGIFNLGTGNPVSFHHVAQIISKKYDSKIITIPFPENLKGKYQKYTAANLNNLQQCIGNYEFKTIN